jgi:hypothetical protein
MVFQWLANSVLLFALDDHFFEIFPYGWFTSPVLIPDHQAINHSGLSNAR